MSKDILGSRLLIGTPPAGGADSQLRDPLNLVNVAGENGTTAWFTDYHNSGGSPNGVNLRIATARGTPATPLTVQNGDYIYEIEAFAYNGTSFTEGAEIKVVVDGACVAGQAVPTRMEFWTNLVNALPQRKAYITAYGTLVTLATAAGGSGLNIPHGVVPTSPVNGDLWTTSAGGLFGRVNGVTQNYAALASPTFTGTVSAAAITMTGQLKINAASALISTGTSDGSDSSTLELNGGGGSGTSRGARILLNGNEAGAFGDLDIDAGVGGWINLRINGTDITRWVDTGGIGLLSNIATTAGGNATGIKLGSADAVGIFFGSGAPTITAPKGSLYMRTDGTTTLTRMYVNTDSGTTWTGIVTVA